MKYIKQFLIILLMAVLGGFLNWLIPLPIPATVWGMVLMFAALMCGIVKLDQVEDTADFFMSIMPMLFIPLAVSLMDNYKILAEYALPIIIIVLASFFLCFAVTGKIADSIIERKTDTADGVFVRTAEAADEIFVRAAEAADEIFVRAAEAADVTSTDVITYGSIASRKEANYE